MNLTPKINETLVTTLTWTITQYELQLTLFFINQILEIFHAVVVLK